MSWISSPLLSWYYKTKKQSCVSWRGGFLSSGPDVPNFALWFLAASEVSPAGKLWGAAAAGFPHNHRVLCGAETIPAVAGPQPYLGKSYWICFTTSGGGAIPLAQRHWQMTWLWKRENKIPGPADVQQQGWPQVFQVSNLFSFPARKC